MYILILKNAGRKWVSEFMVITKFEAKTKGKYKVYIDEEYHFVLYSKDINIYKLEEGKEISEAVYLDIYKNTVLRRGKQKALALLKVMDRTKQELIMKLKQADYSEKTVEDIIAYIESFHYIDDARYASNYVQLKKNSKSKRQIVGELSQKGIDKSIIEEAIAEDYDSEVESIKKAIQKKCKNIEDLSKEERAKVAAYLYRKGYQMDLIKKYVYDDDYE